MKPHTSYELYLKLYKFSKHCRMIFIKLLYYMQHLLYLCNTFYVFNVKNLKKSQTIFKKKYADKSRVKIERYNAVDTVRKRDF